MTGAADSTSTATDSPRATSTPPPDKTVTETRLPVQYSGATVSTTVATGARAAAAPPPSLHPAGRRRRASMQEALDHTKINTSLYDPTLVRQKDHSTRLQHVAKWTRVTRCFRTYRAVHTNGCSV